jgi:putative ABC transport system permease protein
MPGLEQARMDFRVLLFALMLSLLTGLAFGLAPALRASRVDMHGALKEAGRSATGGPRSQRPRNVLVIVEVALSVVLLTGAGLMLRSLDRLLRIDLGFDAGRVLTMRVPVPNQIKGMPQQAQYVSRLIERLRPLPGLNALGMTTVLPLGDVEHMLMIAVEGRRTPEEQSTAVIRSVNAGYFRAMGIALRQGRVFDESDDAAAPPVAVVSETLARRYLPDENPIGRRVYMSGAGAPITIVGVVGDVKRGSVTESGEAELYRDYRQHLSPAFSTTLVLRTSLEDPARLSAAVVKEIRAFNPDQAIRTPRTMRQVVAESLAQPWFYTRLLGAFAAIALVLAAIGLYGVLSYSVSRRAHEIGIRMALGASRQAVVRQVVGQALVLGAAGVSVGLAGSWALTRLIASILYQTSPTDPLTFGGVSLLLILVALAASWVPARRAMAVDPAVALRSE